MPAVARWLALLREGVGTFVCLKQGAISSRPTIGGYTELSCSRCVAVVQGDGILAGSHT